MRTVFRVGFLIAIVCTSARGDGLVFQLPKDGSFIQYQKDVDGIFETKKFNGQQLITIRALGEVNEGDIACRWIEFRFDEVDSSANYFVVKCLIPVKYFKQGENPGEHIIRAWAKAKDTSPHAVENVKEMQSTLLRGMLEGPQTNAKELDPIDVKSSLGVFSCAGVAGDYEFEFHRNGTFALHVENRHHEKAPFGVVGATWKIEWFRDGKSIGTSTTRFHLIKTGVDAVSGIPDKW